MNQISVQASTFTPKPVTIQKTTRDQWKVLWQTFRGMRKLLGEREALVLIQKYCKRDALLILEVIL